MTQTFKIGLFIGLVLICFKGQSQNEQSEYLKAKNLFDSGEYRFAMKAFENVFKTDNPLSDYAFFYYGLCAFKNGQLGLARSVWLQMDRQKSNWHEIPDVRYWLSKVYFEEGNIDKAVEYAKRSKLKASAALIRHELSKVDSVPQLRVVYQHNNNNSVIATILADKIADQPLKNRDFELLNEIVHRFDFDREKYGLPNIGESVIKERYKVAVLLPFLFDGLNNAKKTAKNKFVMDLYVGIQESVKELNKEGSEINVYAYDTKRSKEVTENIFSRPELQSMDLIIGPLFPKPIEVAMKFSYQKKINLINPLSRDTELIAYNPYAFLLRSAVKTQAKVAAEIVADSVENKTAMVFYDDNSRDSLSAYTYSQELLIKGFDVLLTAGIRDTTVQNAFNMLTEKFEVLYTEKEKDSLLLLDESRIIKERKSIKEKNVTEYYEEFFEIAPDSIGHIYVASSKPLFASTFIGAVEIRNDSTLIVGQGAWQRFENLTYEELERLGIWMIDPDYMDNNASSYNEFKDSFIKKYRTRPTFNNLLGYEVMNVAGGLMKKYGNYFQNGTSVAGDFKGRFFEGFNFRFSNSNQYVPITRFENAVPVVINPIVDESVEE